MGELKLNVYNMKRLFPLVLLLQCCIPLESRVTSCISCSSESGSNEVCEQHPEQLLPVPCQEDAECGGVDACCVLFINMYLYGKTITARGCCKEEEDDESCPMFGPEHEDNGFYEIFRKRCFSDNCNVMDPAV